MRMIQVGAGAWGSSWAGIVARSPHWELAALVDPDEAALSPLAATARVPAERCFGSLGDAAAAIEADAVLVVVPPVAHGEIALEALEGGFHCLVEKPLATSIGEAREVVKRADEAGRILMASQNFRFDSGYRTVCGLVADGTIGRAETVFVSFRRAPLFVGFRLEMDEPLIIDMAVHHLDQVRGLLRADTRSLRAHSFNPSWSPFRGNAAASIELMIDGGAVVSYDGSWVARGPETDWNGDWRLEGEAGAIVWSGDSVEVFAADAAPGGRLWRFLRRGQARVPVARLREEGRSGVLAEFAAAISEGRDPETSGRDNLGTLELVFAAVEAARSGQEVRLAS
jgi:predicted dehydrogenase